MDNVINNMWLLLCVLLCFAVEGGFAEQCGRQAGGALCPDPDNPCCSQFGWCGSTYDYCGLGCQSQCGGAPTPSGGLADIISGDTFNLMLKHCDDPACLARGFYTYEAFIQAAKSFPSFATTGDTATRKREVAPDGPYA